MAEPKAKKTNLIKELIDKTKEALLSGKSKQERVKALMQVIEKAIKENAK